MMTPIFVLLTLSNSRQGYCILLTESQQTQIREDAWPYSARAVATDSAGNIYVTGLVLGAMIAIPESIQPHWVWIAKYSPSLILLASTVITDRSVGIEVNGFDLLVDALGNIYIAGVLAADWDQRAVWVGKFDPSLTLLSSATINTLSGRWDEAMSGGLGSQGQYYVAGSVWEDAQHGGRNIWLARYDNSLVMETSTTFTASADSYDAAFGLAVANNDEVYVTGFSSKQAWIGKYSPSLVLQSSVSLQNNTNTTFAVGHDITIDALGDLYLTGYRQTPSSGADVLIAKFDSSLIMLGSATINGAANGTDSGYGVTTDSNKLFVTGIIEENVDGWNLWVAEFDSSLALQSSTSIHGTISTYDTYDAGLDTTLDRFGNLLVGGSVDNMAWIGKFATHGSIARTDNETLVAFNPTPGAVQVLIPAGAFSQSVNVAVRTPATLPSSSLSPTRLTGTGIGVEILLDRPIQPSRTVTVSVSYRDSDVAGLDESKLILARFDTGRNIWVPLSSTPDPLSNRVVSQVDHLSTFQIMQALSQDDLSRILVFPNPLRPAKGHNNMTFTNLPAGARLRIHTLLGELVRDLTADAAGMASWDGRNQAGRSAGSGVYFVFVQGAGESRTIKVAVQR